MDRQQSASFGDAPRAALESSPPELTKILTQTYSTCKMTDSWGTWETVFNHLWANGSGTLRDQLRQSCEYIIEMVLRNMKVADVFGLRKQLVIDELLPRSMPLQQFTAMYLALHAAKDRQYVSRDETDKALSVKDVYKKLTDMKAKSSFVIARETPGAILLTYVKTQEQGTNLYATTKDSIESKVIIDAQLGPYSLSDILRSRRCYWEKDEEGKDAKGLALAIKQLYHPVTLGDGGDFSYISSDEEANDSDVTAPLNDNSFYKNRFATNADKKFIYLSVTHMADRYQIDGMQLVAPQMTLEDGTSEPDSIPALSQGIAGHLSHIVKWNPESFPTIKKEHTLSKLYNDRNVSIDLEYKNYCDQHARPAWVDDTMFMRNMQVQERTLALAGLMARRYQTNARTFASNMRAEARANVKPMDLGETIRTLSSLDLRRGSGAYSSILRIPPSIVEPAYTLSRLPTLQMTWDTFFENFALLSSTLEPHVS